MIDANRAARVDCVGRSVAEHEQAHLRVVLTHLSKDQLNASFQTEGFSSLADCNAARSTTRERLRQRVRDVGAVSSLVDLCQWVFEELN